MDLLYLTASRAHGGKLNEVNNWHRAVVAGAHPGVMLGGPGFDAPVGEVLHLPDYVGRVAPQADCVFVSDPSHNFWDPCDDYPNCPSLYSGIDDLDLPVVIESGDSQFYQEEYYRHLLHRPDRAVVVRAMSHAWRFDANLEPLHGGPRPPDGIAGRPVFYLPHGAYDEMVEVARGVEKTCDVFFSGSDLPDSYPARARIARALRAAPDIKTAWLPHPSDRPHDIIGPAFWKKIARARIAVAGTNAYGNLTMRYLEIPASGTLAIGDVPTGEAKLDAWGDHMIDIGAMGPAEIADAIRSALADPEVLARRTARAREFVLSRHHFRVEWARVFAQIERWIGGRPWAA